MESRPPKESGKTGHRAKGPIDQPFQKTNATGNTLLHHGVTMKNVAKEMEHVQKLAENNQEERFPNLWDKIISEMW